jgi:ATP-dependent DNA helicase RecG
LRETTRRDRDDLDESVQYLKGVGPRVATLLEKLGVRAVEDLLYMKPRTWQDRTRMLPISKAAEGELAMFSGRIVDAKLKKIRWRKSILQVVIDDGSGSLILTWFNQPYVAGLLEKAEHLIVWGKVALYRGALQIVVPEFEIVDEEETAEAHQAIMPVYRLTEGLNNRRMRRIVANCIEKHLSDVPDLVPPDIRKKRKLIGIGEAIGKLHFPANDEEKSRALRRLKYDEFFLLESALALHRAEVERSGGAPEIVVTERIDERIRKLFDFAFTADQDKVIADLRRDIASTAPMNRLLQGDVGSGKTVVAIYALLAAVAAKQQAALMAPTEILAVQHHRTLKKLLRKARVEFELLTGATSAAEKRKIVSAAASGELDILIGTHSLIEESVDFARLGLVVTDEQHKFGVLQRAALRRKGANPHSLVMTATPIPRTLTLTVFGDLDVSTIENGPPGRKDVVTRWAPGDKRDDAFEFIRKKLREGRQAYFVYPLIDEGEKKDIKSAVTTAKELKTVFPGFGVELVTGAMKSEAKAAAMSAFRSGKARILVATVVIEVGIDIPNASIMVIENAERFGLSQLHQLRGRIGRGRHRSYCILFGEPATDEAAKRLEVMAATSDGFRIAEEDLKIRGPGEFFGTRQHGLPEFRFADIIEDWKILNAAREDAFELVRQDASLGGHRELHRRVLARYGGELDLFETG